MKDEADSTLSDTRRRFRLTGNFYYGSDIKRYSTKGDRHEVG